MMLVIQTLRLSLLSAPGGHHLTIRVDRMLKRLKLTLN
jgi:hypothetical protein